ncbi:ATP-binding protein, partial [Legionella shakespearei]
MSSRTPKLSNKNTNPKNHAVFFETYSQESDILVFFVNNEYFIEKIILKSTNEYYCSIQKLVQQPFIEVINYLNLNSNDIISLLEQAKTTLYEHLELHDDPTFRYNYSLSVTHDTHSYTVILKVIDRKNDTLKSYINTIINTLPGAVYWKDKDGCYLGCNKFVASMAGFDKPQQLLGKTDFDLCWNEFAQEWRDFDLEVMREQKTYKREESVRLADGRVITEITIKSPLYNEKNEVVGIIGTSMDITEQKTLEQDLIAARKKAEAANQAKTEFLSNMRHDIRTPLSGIVGFSEILKSESNQPRIKEYADNLVASSHALLDLMDEVLEAVKVSSGEIPRLKRKFNLCDTLGQVISLYCAKAQEKGLNLSLSVDKNLPRYVIGDKIRMHRIALELIGNALNFTDNGHVTVSVELAKKEQRHLVIKMTVSDSGMGIPQDKQQEIYLQFKRLTPSYQGIYKGAGLGLYVVKQFIDELEGEIYVDSEPQKGTVFTCLIPLQEPLLDDDSGIDNTVVSKTEKRHLSPLTHKQEAFSLMSESKTKSKVLVVEDNFIAQTVAKTLLSGMDCQVDVASSGIDALALYDKIDYDLIFMDIGLGEGIDGYEVTHHIRSKTSVVTKHIPIIALTAHGGDESKQRCIEAGMDAVLTKPLTQAHAIDIIKSFIPERHEPSEIKSSETRKDLPDSDDEMFQLNQFPI